jgi:hypothetical protein
MVCVHVPLLLNRNVGVLLGVLRGPPSDAPFFSLLWFCIIVMFSCFLYAEDGQLTKTCKGNKYLEIETHWTVLTIIL